MAAVVGAVSAGCSLEDAGSPPEVSTAQSGTAESTTSETPAEVPPLDVEAFLTDSDIPVESARISARKAVIYVPTETTGEQAGDAFPAVTRVEVSDSVSIYAEGYDADEDPSEFATDEVCDN